jgi:hypothetical protein
MEEKLTDVRSPERNEFGRQIPHGGWHNSRASAQRNDCPEKRAITKLTNPENQEIKVSRNLRNFRKQIPYGQRVIIRTGPKFRRFLELSFLPAVILPTIEKDEPLLG